MLTNTKVESHTLEEKTIPSGFFDLPGSENVSAIVFSNSGTHAKFTRMGYQSGFGNDVLKVQRVGRVFDPSPDSMDSALFAYDMDDPNVVEPWGQGLSVLHNPKALIPVPDGFFPHANEHHLTDGGIAASTDGWHPFNSTTMVLDLGKVRKDKFFRALLGHGPRVVAAIPKPHFWSFDPFVELDGEEDGWYADEFEAFLGLVLRREKDWKAIVLARDYHFRFFPIAKATGMSSRFEAVDRLQHKMMGFLGSPRRLFDEAVG